MLELAKEENAKLFLNAKYESFYFKICRYLLLTYTCHEIPYVSSK